MANDFNPVDKIFELRKLLKKCVFFPKSHCIINQNYYTFAASILTVQSKD